MVVHVLICALDYKGTKNPLTCTFDGNNVQELLKKCNNVGQVKVLYDNEATETNCEAAIREIAQNFGQDDYFIFYYSGHGSSVPDKDGDEADGKDEALCFMGPRGELEAKYFMTDDELARCCTSFPSGSKIIILTDCCHSGTIGDLDKPCWNDFEAVTITGCTDTQTSGDMGKGGIFTHAMLLAIDKLDNHGRAQYSVGQLYKATLKEDNEVFHSKQDITINASRGCHPDQMDWPLIPQEGYVAPLNGAIGALGGGSGGAGGGGASGIAGGQINVGSIVTQLLQNPHIMQQFNLSPAVVQCLAAGAQKLAEGYAKRGLQRGLGKAGVSSTDSDKLFEGAESLMKMGRGMVGRFF